MSRDTVKNIINKIKSEKIKPKPKTFDYKNLLYWLMLVFMVALGAISFSLILLGIMNLGFGWRHYIRSFSVLFIVLPYLWIIFFVIFISLGFLSFRRTKRGYRYNNLMIIGYILLAIFILGFIAHEMKIDSKFNSSISNRVPLHRMMGPEHEGIWKKSEQGMLGGEIMDINKNIIKLRDFDGAIWTVKYSESTRIRKNIQLQGGMKVAIIGKKTDEFSFEASGIKLFQDHRKPKQLNRHMLNNKHPMGIMKTF